LFDSYNDFEDWYYDLDDKTMHEVIFGFLPQRPKFDIDAPKEFMDALNVDTQDKGEYILESITEAITDVMQAYYYIDLDSNDFAIATSTGPEKFSAHIVLKNYVVDNNREAVHLNKLLIDDHLPKFVWHCVDAGVNKSIQNFRLLFSHKVGSDQVKAPLGHGFLKEFIIGHSQMTDQCQSLPPLAPAATDFEAEVADEAVNQVLEMVAPYLDGQRFDKKKSNMLTFRRTKPTHCVLCKRIHNSNNTVFITVYETVILLHCRKSEDRMVIRDLGRAADEVDGFDDELVAQDEPVADDEPASPDAGQPPEDELPEVKPAKVPESTTCMVE